MSREVVLGIDSSTQSTKVLVVDLASGEVLKETSAPHSGGTVQDPRDWWQALRTAVHAAADARFVACGISVAAQQHGFVTLDERNEVVLPAPLWNNVDSALDAVRLNELADFSGITGTRLVASITITKLAHLARTAPDVLRQTAAVCLPHDYLNLRLTGNLVTDRGEASGSGWWEPDGSIRRDLLALAAGCEAAERLRLPAVLGPEEIAGTLRPDAAAELGLPAGIPIGPGTGDNMAAALGVGARGDELVVSLGTSGVAYAVRDHATHDASGEVAGFADATGRFMPLACMLNCTLVVDKLAAMLGVERIDALDRAGRVAPGANGLLITPYLGGERTPNLPHAAGSILGLTAANADPDLMVRAAVDGVVAGLAYCVAALDRVGVRASVVTLVGGGSRHPTWRQAITDVTGLPVRVLGGGEHAARGAAIQIAAIIRREKVADLASAWRPPIIAEAAPRPETHSAFRLDERRRLIETMAHLAAR